jgi:hypothetical protein
MAEVAGIGALLKPNKYSILKFVDLHPGGAAALSGQVCGCGSLWFLQAPAPCLSRRPTEGAGQAEKQATAASAAGGRAMTSSMFRGHTR